MELKEQFPKGINDYHVSIYSFVIWSNEQTACECLVITLMNE